MEDGVNPDTGNSALSLSEGAQELSSLFGGGNAADVKEPGREAGEPEQANEADATDQVLENETHDGDQPEEGDEADQSEEDAAPDDDKPEEPAKFRLKDGTEVTLDDVEEWRRGNLRDADYRRKTMELAATRKELETRLSDIQQMSQYFEQNAEFAIALAQAHLPQPPDLALLDADPIGYVRSKVEYEARIGQLQQLVAAKQLAEQDAQSRQSDQSQQNLRGEMEQLVAKMPELGNPEKARQFNADLTKGIERYGFTPQDLAQVADHRLILMAKDAMAYQRIMANKPKAQAKAVKAAPMQVPGHRPGPKEVEARASKDKWDNLRRNGSLESGAAVLLDLIKGT